MQRMQRIAAMTEAEREAHLRTHVERRYGVRITHVEQLDRAVFALTLADGHRWVARVFASSRPLVAVERDAEVLRFLERQGYPAERCADATPVSSAAGLTVCITEYIAGTAPTKDVATLRAAGDLLGRLHALPADTLPASAGALHHYVPMGGEPAEELVAAASWLAEVEERVPASRRAPGERLREHLAGVDDCHGLPTALLHPDPVLKNLLVMPQNGVVFVDWTGAGRGPRLFSFAVLLWSGALAPRGWSPEHVEAVVAGYRAHVNLDPEEIDRLAGVLCLRPVVFACWRFRHAVKTGHIPSGSEWWWPNAALANAIAEHARAVLRK